jgi:uncharacterized protein YjcR
MARICDYYYKIELTNGSFNKIKREEFSRKIEEYYEDFLTNDIYSITKIYKLKEINKRFKMTLFTTEYNFKPEDYIEHYTNLQEDLYGVKTLNEFDILVIEKFN